jgi:ACR3 family arsenite efflux pump ArsB
VREGGNPLSALRRSLHLIGGHRWRIVALLAMMILLYFVFAFGGGMILGVVYTVLRIPVPLQAPVVIELVVTQILNVFCYAMAAASYHPLRYEKDGPEHIVVAQVFD